MAGGGNVTTPEWFVIARGCLFVVFWNSTLARKKFKRKGNACRYVSLGSLSETCVTSTFLKSARNPTDTLYHRLGAFSVSTCGHVFPCFVHPYLQTFALSAKVRVLYFRIFMYSHPEYFVLSSTSKITKAGKSTHWTSSILFCDFHGTDIYTQTQSVDRLISDDICCNYLHYSVMPCDHFDVHRFKKYSLALQSAFTIWQIGSQLKRESRQLRWIMYSSRQLWWNM